MSSSAAVPQIIVWWSHTWLTSVKIVKKCVCLNYWKVDNFWWEMFMNLNLTLINTHNIVLINNKKKLSLFRQVHEMISARAVTATVTILLWNITKKSLNFPTPLSKRKKSIHHPKWKGDHLGLIARAALFRSQLLLLLLWLQLRQCTKSPETALAT